MNFKKNSSIIVGIAFVFFFAQSALAQWTPPTTSPTGGNNFAPINTSAFPQIKFGAFATPNIFSHAVLLRGCQSGSPFLNLSLGVTCSNIASLFGNNKLFEAGDSDRHLQVLPDGTTMVTKTSQNVVSAPDRLFRAGRFDGSNYFGLMVNDNGAASFNAGTTIANPSGMALRVNGATSITGIGGNNPPVAGDVLTAVGPTGELAWAPGSGGGTSLWNDNNGVLHPLDINKRVSIGADTLVNPLDRLQISNGDVSINNGGLKVMNGVTSLYYPNGVPGSNLPAFFVNVGGVQQLRVNLSGGVRIRPTGSSPQPGHVLTALNTTGDVEWQPTVAGMPAGNIHETLRHDGTNWVANNFLFNDGASVNIGNQSPISGVALNVTGLTAMSGSLAVTDGAHFAMQSGNVGVGVSGTSTPPFAARKLDVDGSFRVRQSGLTSNMVLSSAPSNDGTVQWTDINTLITQTPSGTSLPSGSTHQTFRHDGANWVANNFLQSSPTQVRIGGTAPGSSSPFSFTVDGTSRLVGNTVFDGGTVVLNGPVRIPASAGATKVLTSDSSGYATWQPVPAGATLPSGTTDQTLRYDGTNWVANSILTTAPTSGGLVSINGRLNVNADIGTNQITGGQNVLMGGLRIITSSNMGTIQGKVLTASDNNGLATWQDINTLPGGSVAQTLYYDNDTGWTANNVLKTYAAFSPKVAINENGTFGSNNVEVLDVWGQIKMRGGAPSQGKVLTSLDSEGRAAWAYPVPKITRKVASNNGTGGNIAASVTCDNGDTLISGGVSCSNSLAALNDSYPSLNAQGWTGSCSTPANTSNTTSVFALCAQSL